MTSRCTHRQGILWRSCLKNRGSFQGSFRQLQVIYGICHYISRYGGHGTTIGPGPCSFRLSSRTVIHSLRQYSIENRKNNRSTRASLNRPEKSAHAARESLVASSESLTKTARYSPRLFHNASIRAFVPASIKISSGHGRANPSVAHLRVASIPIFEPRSWMREA
jgi:hypothetical protein